MKEHLVRQGSKHKLQVLTTKRNKQQQKQKRTDGAGAYSDFGTRVQKVSRVGVAATSSVRSFQSLTVLGGKGEFPVVSTTGGHCMHAWV